jgi:hypothetical protein
VCVCVCVRERERGLMVRLDFSCDVENTIYFQVERWIILLLISFSEVVSFGRISLRLLSFILLLNLIFQ